MKIYARQGDIAIFRLEDGEIAPGKAFPRHNGRIILAEGEATGHAHAIVEKTATLHELEGTTDTFLSVMEKAMVVHEEHGKIELSEGSYLVRRQVEYIPNELPRQVQD